MPHSHYESPPFHLQGRQDNILSYDYGDANLPSFLQLS